jgi:hypothetical protein
MTQELLLPLKVILRRATLKTQNRIDLDAAHDRIVAERLCEVKNPKHRPLGFSFAL